MSGEENPTETHERLGTEEFCRRIKELDPQRHPLFHRRDQLYIQLAGVQRSWWEWIQAHEAELPQPLQDLAQMERALLAELDRIDRDLEALWRAKMVIVPAPDVS